MSTYKFHRPSPSILIATISHNRHVVTFSFPKSNFRKDLSPYKTSDPTFNGASVTTALQVRMMSIRRGIHQVA